MYLESSHARAPAIVMQSAEASVMVVIKTRYGMTVLRESRARRSAPMRFEPENTVHLRQTRSREDSGRARLHDLPIDAEAPRVRKEWCAKGGAQRVTHEEWRRAGAEANETRGDAAMSPGPIVNLPPWVWFIYFDVRFWFVSVPAAIALVLFGWCGADWLRSLRWAAFGAAALLALPFPIAGALIVIGEIRAAIDLAALERTLDRDETIAGMALPAGSTVRYRDKARTSAVSIELPRATDILGLRLAGRVDWSEFSQVWTGTLAEDQRLDGWPCRAGSVEFDKGGIVQSCDLATAHELLGLTLPRGSHVTRGNADRPWALRLPDDAEMAVPRLATTAPAGVTLDVTSDGRLERITSGDGQTIVVRGVPLNSMNFYVRGDKVVAALADPSTVEGEMRPAGTGVRIDLSSGDVALAGKNWWLSE
jgi:hypothetical protein